MALAARIQLASISTFKRKRADRTACADGLLESSFKEDGGNVGNANTAEKAARPERSVNHLFYQSPKRPFTPCLVISVVTGPFLFRPTPADHITRSGGKGWDGYLSPSGFLYIS